MGQRNSTRQKIAGSADPLFFIRAILDSAAKMLKPTLNLFAKMLGIVVISAAIGAVGGVTNSESIREVAGIVTKMCLIAAMSENILSLIDETSDYIKLVTGVGEAAVPVFSAICIAGGNVTGASGGGERNADRAEFHRNSDWSGAFSSCQGVPCFDDCRGTWGGKAWIQD